MSTSLWQLFDRTMEFEGGFSDHPQDLGGPTAFGVTCWAWAKHIGKPLPPPPRKLEDLYKPEVRAFFDEMRPIMARVTKGEAKAFLFQHYVEKPKISTVEPVSIAAHVADISVNSGPKRAVRMLQDVLVDSGMELAVDGVIGPQTRAAVKMVCEVAGEDLLNDALALERAKFFVSLRQPSFIRGWLRRAAGFAASQRAKNEILEMM